MKNMGNLGNLGKLMKQAGEMQARVQELQEKMAERSFEASSGGGVVTAVVNGRQELLSIRVSPEVVDPQDVAMLEDLVVAAVNGARQRAEEEMRAEMQKLTGGLGLPPGLF
jgi:DNA-binding YbaB/EbfC family protein